MRNTAQRSVTTKWKGGADDAALLSDIGRFFSATAASTGIDTQSPTEHRPPFPSFTEQT